MRAAGSAAVVLAGSGPATWRQGGVGRVATVPVRLQPSAMEGSIASAVPTITFEEALRREMEYRKRLERTHPHLLIALSGALEGQEVSFLGLL